MQILVLSPRVAPGVLTLAAWDALRAATSVRAVSDDPHVRAIVDAGIHVEIVGEPPTTASDAIWIAPPGDPAWVGAVVATLADTPDVEILRGSHALPGSTLLDVVEVMDRLRRECPWTALQTHETLAPYVLEEAQEVHEAILEGDADHLREELGDLLMQVVFHARIAAETPTDQGGGWDVDDVAAGIAAKLVRRNPHVFAPETLDHVPTTPDEIDAQWQRIKRQERGGDPAERPA